MTLSDLDGGVEVVESVVFTTDSTEAVVTLSAATIASEWHTGRRRYLDAEGATVEPALLAVEIAPRTFTLAFDLATVAIVAGGTAQTTLTLTGADALVESDQFTWWSFAYDSPDDGVEVVESVLFTADSTEAVVTLSAATITTNGTLTASVSDAEGAVIEVEPALLAVEIAPRMFTLAFDLATVAIVAGGTDTDDADADGSRCARGERSVYGELCV